MATRTVEIDEEVYDRLTAQKRDEECFSDTLDRLLDERTPDWRRGFGRYGDDSEESEVFERVVTESRRE